MAKTHYTDTRNQYRAMYRHMRQYLHNARYLAKLVDQFGIVKEGYYWQLNACDRYRIRWDCVNASMRRGIELDSWKYSAASMSAIYRASLKSLVDRECADNGTIPPLFRERMRLYFGSASMDSAFDAMGDNNGSNNGSI